MNSGTFKRMAQKPVILAGIFCDDFTKLTNILLYGHFQPREFVVDDEKKLIYLVNSKVACSSIKACMCGVESDNDSVHSIVGKSGKLRKNYLSEAEKQYFIFTFVRNPFTRLVSCYESKYHNDKTYYKKAVSDFDRYLFGYIREDKGFDDFVRKVVKIPDCLLDKHFCIQSKLITDNSGRILADYIGKMENLNEDFMPIAMDFDLPELPHFNRTDTDKKNWMDYYSTETAKLVFKKYRSDIERFGYKDSYISLRKHLRAQGR